MKILKHLPNVYENLLHTLKTAKYFEKNSKRQRSRTVLGIETSCDDTGAAIITEDGKLLAHQLNSQTAYHVQKGGINPPYARDLHLCNIDQVVQDTLQEANMSMKDISAMATTTRPGLASCLTVGLNYSLQLVKKYQIPFLPIHHMQAHALTPRFQQNIPFPYLVLLMSGGHCLLVVARAVDDFLLLGNNLDDAPGEAFDKVARRLRLKDLPGNEALSGGVAMERAAMGGNQGSFPITKIMQQVPDCNFSFAGLKAWTLQQVEKEEIRQGLAPNHGHLNNLNDFCASFQHNVFRHIAKRLQRAMLFCHLKDLLGNSGADDDDDSHHNEAQPYQHNLVLSGGVASNQYGRSLVEKVCHHHGYNLICPPPPLCTDNGLMIAWNGVELLRVGKGVSQDPFAEQVYPRQSIGRDISADVRSARIKLPRIKWT